MFERFTDRARRVIVLAQEEARILNHNYIGTEHILLGLVHESGGVASDALESLGVSLEAARQQVEEIIGRGRQAPSGHIPFRPEAKKTLELSLREAMAFGSEYIGTEHLLLALVREGDNPGVRVLTALGADPNRVRQQVVQLMSASRGEDEAEVRLVRASGERASGERRDVLSEVRGRLDSVESRLSALEQRVGTKPDSRQLEQEGATLPSLSDEIERLRDLLRRHGIDAQDDAV